MSDKNSAVDEFLNSEIVKGESSDNAIQPERDPFANLKVEQEENSSNEGEKGEKKDEEKPVPFHQDPKLRRFIAKEIEKATQGMSPRQAAEVRAEMSNKPDLLSAFTKIIGNDTPDKVEALNMLKNTLDEIRSEASSAKELIENEKRAEREAEQELYQGFENIEDSFNVDLTSNDPVARKTRSEFIDFIQRVAPKNADGEILAYPDFHETFTLFQEMRKKGTSPNRAKDLASRSMERSSDASKIPVPADSSWKGVDKFFSTLKG